MNHIAPLRLVVTIVATLWGTNALNWVVTISRKIVLLAIVVSWALFLWKYPTLPPLIPLWYGKPWGIDRLAHPLWLMLLPGGSFVVLMTNIMAEKVLTHDMLVFTQILELCTLLVAILSLVTLTKILFLVS
ncbi:MAG: hypothetical protein AAB481_04560 [Patescibacteria group bacterium]